MGKLPEAEDEMETLLREDRNSPSIAQFKQILEEIKQEQLRLADAKLHPAQSVSFTVSSPAEPTSAEATRQARQILQDLREKNQIAEAEADPDPACSGCGIARPSSVASSETMHKPGRTSFPEPVVRVAVDRVAIFFAATDHGKSVTDLTASDVAVLDDSRPPETILTFRNESQLPLRLGLVIDTSNSVTSRFSFEQTAAREFLQKVVTNPNDMTAVIGVNNSVLLAQDLTPETALSARAVSELAPGGGTALWDAVAFGADKLSRPETQPVARVLVVISDGDDNSSTITLKQAIARAQQDEVIVYSVSTRDLLDNSESAQLGDHALKALSELSGGASFVPGSIRHFRATLNELQEAIRGRYLLSYKPAAFQRDGHYRVVDIQAEKQGRKLKVYARRGYYASAEERAAEP
jgi:VWFA-related protein